MKAILNGKRNYELTVVFRLRSLVHALRLSMKLVILLGVTAAIFLIRHVTKSVAVFDTHESVNAKPNQLVIYEKKVPVR